MPAELVVRRPRKMIALVHRMIPFDELPGRNIQQKVVPFSVSPRSGDAYAALMTLRLVRSRIHMRR
jgi:hypothetical protein